MKLTREQAEAMINAIKLMREQATDEQAVAATAVYPFWKTGTAYTVNERVQHNSVLYKCAQAHTSQDNWTPDATPAMWVAISLDPGTVTQPITAVRGMEYEQDKYYLDPEDEKVYLCTRGGVLHYLPHELVGQYFELA